MCRERGIESTCKPEMYRGYIWVYREGLRNMLLKYGIGGGKYSGGGMYSEWEKD